MVSWGAVVVLNAATHYMGAGGAGKTAPRTNRGGRKKASESAAFCFCEVISARLTLEVI